MASTKDSGEGEAALKETEVDGELERRAWTKGWREAAAGEPEMGEALGESTDVSDITAVAISTVGD